VTLDRYQFRLLLTQLAVITVHMVFLAAIPLHLYNLGNSEFSIGIIVGAYAFGSIILRMLLFSKFSEVLSRSLRPYVTLLCITSLLTPVVPEIGFVILRIVHGFSLAAIGTIVLSYSYLHFTGTSSRAMVGYIGACTGIAVIVGPVLGIEILKSFGFRYIGISVAILLFGVVFLTPKKPKSVKELKIENSRRPFTILSIWVVMVFVLGLVLGGLEAFLPVELKDLESFSLSIAFVIFGCTLVVGRILGGTTGISFVRLVFPPSISACALIPLLWNNPLLIYIGIAFFGISFGIINTKVEIQALEQNQSDMTRSSASVSLVNDLGIGIGAVISGAIVGLYSDLFVPFLILTVLIVPISLLVRRPPIKTITSE